ncbi:hypothetical protein LSAT2_001242 [Lamellibrachia satsuma]|nr:hypothetical protein LSAT2_001242 [Lamellibrachia satsuma]
MKAKNVIARWGWFVILLGCVIAFYKQNAMMELGCVVVSLACLHAFYKKNAIVELGCFVVLLGCLFCFFMKPNASFIPVIAIVAFTTLGIMALKTGALYDVNFGSPGFQAKIGERSK